jgi:hypothetical protein
MQHLYFRYTQLEKCNTQKIQKLISYASILAIEILKFLTWLITYLPWIIKSISRIIIWEIGVWRTIYQCLSTQHTVGGIRPVFMHSNFKFPSLIYHHRGAIKLKVNCRPMDNGKLIIKSLLGWFCYFCIIWLRLQKEVLHLSYDSIYAAKGQFIYLFFIFILWWN